MNEEHSRPESVAKIIDAQSADGEHVQTLVSRVRHLEQLVQLLMQDKLQLTREITRLRATH